MLVLSLIFTAAFCLILKNSFLLYFIALELFVLAINLQFIFSSPSLLESRGIFVAVILLAIAAIDTAIGLSLLIKYQNITYRISIALVIFVLKYVNLMEKILKKQLIE